MLSPYPSALVRSIDTAAAAAVAGVFRVVTASDLPPVEVAGPDQPLAVGRVYYSGQPVAAVLAESEAAAADAAALVDVDYEVLVPVVDPFAAMEESSPQVLEEKAEGFDDASIHGGGAETGAETERKPRNVSAIARQGRGDVAAGFAESDAIVEGRYVMPGAHQGFIEPHVVQAAPENGGVTVWSPTQGHRFARDEIAKLLKLPTSRVRVVPMPVGGGFGGKVVLLEPLTALLAVAAGAPVRLALTRSEEFQVGRPAPASYTDLKLGARRDGTITALEVRMVWDNGAASGFHGGLAGTLFGIAYRLPNFAFAAFEVSTNKTPVDAYRAPAGTQAFFALESALDELAAKLGLDPIELRITNARSEGERLPEGGRAPLGILQVLEAARTHPLRTAALQPGEGLGIALGAWGGAYGPANALCRLESDGVLTVQIGSVDISGSSTGFAMIAAETFGVPLERVAIEFGDSGSAPQGPVAGGSAVSYSVGPAVQAAAAEARRQVLDLASEELEAEPGDLEIENGEVRVKGVPTKSIPIGQLAMGGSSGPAVLGRGRARVSRQSPAFTVHLCRVRVDRATGGFEVTGYAAIQDVGFAINPPEIRGQIQGGVAQGLGRAMGEQLFYDRDGQLKTGSFLDYELPAADQLPEIEVTIVEVPSGLEPLGTRGVGEPPAVPGPAAFVNAVASATGLRIRELPVAAESLLA